MRNLLMTSSDKTTLLFFTHSYPYGTQESFIETELPYLSNFFDEIIIIPFVYGKSKTPRETPKNVRILDPLLNQTPILNILLKGIFNNVNISAFLSELKLKNIFKIIDIFKHSIIARYLVSHQTFKQLMEIKNCVAYFYWGVNWSNVIAFYDFKIKTVVRFHGYDLYNDRGIYHPFREKIFSKIDAPIFISEHGKNYATKKFGSLNNNFKLYRPGVKSLPCSSTSNNEVLHIVSCANLIPLKRIELLSEAILKIKSFPIEWTHFGDGPCKDLIINNPCLQYKGRVQNSEVLEHYRRKPVDLFIHTSRSEGLPVSIMEAIAASIPVIATDAGGTKELIQEVLPIEITAEELAEKISQFYQTYFKNSDYKNFFFNQWYLKANAENNYRDFALFLKSLC